MICMARVQYYVYARRQVNAPRKHRHVGLPSAGFRKPVGERQLEPATSKLRAGRVAQQRLEKPTDFFNVQVFRIEATPILGRTARHCGAEASRHWTPPCGGATAVMTRVLSSSWGRITRAPPGALDRRENGGRHGLHVDVLDELVGDAELEQSRHAERAGGVPVAFARERAACTPMCRRRCGAEPAASTRRTRSNALGQAVTLAEHGDEASQVVAFALRLVAIRPTEITVGPVMGALVRVVPAFTRFGRAARTLGLDHPVPPACLRRPSAPGTPASALVAASGLVVGSAIVRLLHRPFSFASIS